jgi:hypothetical protein
MNVGVNNMPSVNGSVSVVPVPASTAVTIGVNWNEAQDFTVSVVSINGVLINTWTVKAAAATQFTMPVDAMPTGNYIVKVTGNNGSIVKQFTVAH